MCSRRSWVSTDRTSLRARLCKSHAQGTGVTSYRKAFRHRHLNGGIGLVRRGPLWDSADETGGGSLHFALRGKCRQIAQVFLILQGLAYGRGSNEVSRPDRRANGKCSEAPETLPSPHKPPERRAPHPPNERGPDSPSLLRAPCGISSKSALWNRCAGSLRLRPLG